MNEQNIHTAIAGIAEQLGIDLAKFGNASPTKLILEAIKTSAETIMHSTEAAMREQNPYTAKLLQSKLGLASISGLNFAKYMQAASGEITITTETPITVRQHDRLIGVNGLPYYVVLSSDVITIDGTATLQVRQGEVFEETVSLGNEDYQTVRLSAKNGIIDMPSVRLDKYSIVYSLLEPGDALAQMSVDGSIDIVLPKNVDQYVKVSYASCFGSDGDIIEIDQLMQSPWPDAIVYVSSPIIGGTKLDSLAELLSNAIVVGGRNNLIGTEASLLNFVHSNTQFNVTPKRLDNGVLRLLVSKSLTRLVRDGITYFEACKELEVEAGLATALANKVNALQQLSLTMLVDAKPALIEHCSLNVSYEGKASIESVLNVCLKSLVEQYSSNAYSASKLYRTLLAESGIDSLNVAFEGKNVDKFGTAMAKSNDAVLVCNSVSIASGVETKTFTA